MQFKVLGAAAALGLAVSFAQATTVSVYDSASFVPTDTLSIELLGFGRGGSSQTLLPSQPMLTPGFEIFFDTWNVNVDAVAPGVYSFSGITVDALGGLTFASVALSSYDALGVRQTVVFDINPAGTQAVGAGQFTVLATCPVSSCVWIDIIGEQPIGAAGGYGGTGIATAVPEPATWASLLGGLALLGAAAARRRARDVG